MQPGTPPATPSTALTFEDEELTATTPAAQADMSVTFETEDGPGAHQQNEVLLILYYLFEDPTWFDREGQGQGIIIHGPSEHVPGAKGGLKLLAFVIMMTTNFLIIVSTLALALETMAPFSDNPHRNPVISTPLWGVFGEWSSKDFGGMWELLEALCVVCFTVDLVVRFVGAFACKHLSRFLGDSMNWIDLVAICPWYITKAIGKTVDLRFVRILRLVRILHVLPAAKHGSLIALITDIIRNSSSALFAPVFFMSLTMTVVAAVMWKVERTFSMQCTLYDGTVVDDWDTSLESPGNEGCTTEFGCACAGSLRYVTYDGQLHDSEMYTSIPDLLWWAMVTFSTVGYGDTYPVTGVGQFIASLSFGAGTFFLAMPITIVGSSFTKSWKSFSDVRDANESEERFREELMALTEGGKTLGASYGLVKDTVVETNLMMKTYYKFIATRLKMSASDCRGTGKPETALFYQNLDVELQATQKDWAEIHARLMMVLAADAFSKTKRTRGVEISKNWQLARKGVLAAMKDGTALKLAARPQAADKEDV